MERMTEKKIGKRKVKVHRMEGLYPYVRLEDFMQVCKGLEEENKKLRDYVDNLDSENDNQAIEIEELKKENKKLKEELKQLEERYDRNAELYKRLLEEDKKLRERIEALELCIDVD